MNKPKNAMFMGFIRSRYKLENWWSRAELKRTLCLVILYRVDCGLYRYLNRIFAAGEAEHQPQVIVINIHRDQECVK